jgi:hypothetical protein
MLSISKLHRDNQASPKVSISLSHSLLNLQWFRPAPPNNDIGLITSPSKIRKVNLNLDSPRMFRAMESIGLVKADLNNTRRMDDFAFELT